jgi:hypothetical protein
MILPMRSCTRTRIGVILLMTVTITVNDIAAPTAAAVQEFYGYRSRSWWLQE